MFIVEIVLAVIKKSYKIISKINIEIFLNQFRNLQDYMVLKSKILVAYYSKGGASEKYANIISDTLKDKGYLTEIFNLSKTIPDISDFDTVVIGTGVRMFRVYRRWKKILKQKTLDKKNLYMFLSSGTAIEDPEKAVEKFLNPLIDKFNLKPKSVISFPGIIPGKWAKLDGGNDTLMPDHAIEWAKEISNQIQKK